MTSHRFVVRAVTLLLSASLPITLVPSASAAPNTDLKAVRAQVEQLQEDAAEAGENAQAAKIQLNKLKKQLSDRKSTRLNSSHTDISRMPSSA